MIVIFDTNSYRDLVAGIDLDAVEPLMKKLLSLESQKGITALMSSVVTEEILGHLLDGEETRTFKSCLKATKAIYMHCGDNRQYRLIPSPQTQMAKEFFGVESKKFKATQDALSLIAYEISKEPTKDTIIKYETQLKQVKTHLRDSEKALADGVREMGRGIDPNYTDWNLFVGNKSMRKKYLDFIRSKEFREGTAKMWLFAVGTNLQNEGLIADPSPTPQMITDYVSRYAAALNMHSLFYELIMNPGFDVTKNSHANYLWDSQIMHVVGHSVTNDDILLVTSDGAMIREANKAIKDKVVTLEEYKKMVGLT